MARQAPFALPVGCSVRHPAYLAPALRRQIKKRFDARGIFLNIPYAARYTRLELAVIATATAYDLRPVLAKQHEKRMNMPFELGIMIAMGKDCFIVSRRKYGGLASISDRSFSRWIESNCSRKRPRVDDLIERYGVGRG